MKKFLCVALLIACCGSCAIDSFAGWGPQGCAPVGALALTQGPPQMKWWQIENRPDEVFLYRGNQLLGSYNYRTGFYHEITGGRWGRSAKAPIAPPLSQQDGDPHGYLFGMEPGRVGAVQAFSHNGVACSRTEAEEAIGANLRDDSKAGHVTYIDGDAARRKAMTERFEAAAGVMGAKDSVRFQAYDPAKMQTREMLAVNRLEADKQFAQAGRVLIAQPASTKPDGSSPASTWYGDITDAQVIEAVRKVAPDWDPNKAPVPWIPSLPAVPWKYLALGILALVAGIVAVRTPH